MYNISMLIEGIFFALFFLYYGKLFTNRRLIVKVKGVLNIQKAIRTFIILCHFNLSFNVVYFIWLLFLKLLLITLYIAGEKGLPPY